MKKILKRRAYIWKFQTEPVDEKVVNRFMNLAGEYDEELDLHIYTKPSHCEDRVILHYYCSIADKNFEDPRWYEFQHKVYNFVMKEIENYIFSAEIYFENITEEKAKYFKN